MNIRSIFNKGLLLVPAVLVAPLFTVASPVVCTSSAGNLDLNSSVIFPESNPVTTFACPGVTLTPPTGLSSDFIDVANVGTTGMIIIGEDLLSFPDVNVVFTGSSSTNPFLQFLISDDLPISEELSVSTTPEPGSILLFGTGLLIAGGFIRRRMLAQSLA